MAIILRKLYVFIFFLGIFFIPFNSFEGIQVLGEFKGEYGAHFLFLAFLILLVDSFRSSVFSIPYSNFVFQLVVIFLLWCVLASLFNAPSIFESYYKRTSGINRFVRQYFALLLSSVLLFLLYWNVIVKMDRQQILCKIRRVFLYSFIAVSIYAFFEILYLSFGFFPAYQILKFFEYFPFVEFTQDSSNRISSVCFEAPALATFLISTAGWMFSYILTNKGITKYIPTAVVLILTYFSGSRTALIVVVFQLLVFLSILLTKQQRVRALGYSVVTILALTTLVFISNGDKIIRDVEKKIESLDFRGNLKTNISNKSRFGIQYANLVVFTQNPIVGVGFGQQGFFARNHYPGWAVKDNFEFKNLYLDKTNPMFPPGYNMYIRLLAETGIIGFLLFVYLLYIVVHLTKKRIKESTNQIDKTLAIILLISFSGFILNWLQLDTFRMYGFWLSLAILINLSKKKNIPVDEK
jgi:O-antigen ligase